MNNIERYYDVLGINVGASEKDVKDAYRDSIKVWHPDRFANENERLKKKAEARTKEVNEAYAIILEHLKKSTKTGQGQSSSGGYNDESRVDMDALAYVNRGKGHYSKGNFDEAINDFTRAVERKPDYVEAYHFRGCAWRDKRRYDKAINDFTRAIELSSNYVDAYFNRGNLWRNKGDIDRAIADWTRAIEIDSGYIMAYMVRSLAWERKGDEDRAMADWKKAAQLGHEPAQRYLQKKGIRW
ncbi:protein containing Heat shock protein DnaJ [Candidatus Magnetobacterium bavaricum]|uniref:Protein containing Heat shock protein DnaJ n=1 Tax=Candidatus Magnetobacterium bavaricum TaxID=29290 RepID=A0A0F3GUJ3_9BACT|nr:protein containing Heat shock protein DnaJ [Candidatus Magnetobacterium bavaricum]